MRSQSSRTVVCTPVPMLIDQPATAIRRSHQCVDDVVDEHEVTCLATVTVEHRRVADATAARKAAATPPSGRWRGPYTDDSAGDRELDRVVVAVGLEQVDHRVPDDALHPSAQPADHPSSRAPGSDRTFLDRQGRC